MPSKSNYINNGYS